MAISDSQSATAGHGSSVNDDGVRSGSASGGGANGGGAAANAGGELLRLQAVSKAFGGVRALRGVTLDLRAGEVHALVGENGAGKSTLVRIVTGAHAADAGTVTVCGQPVAHADPLLMRGLGIAPIYQQPALFPDLTVAENLAVRLERGGAWRRIDWRRRRSKAATLLADVGAQVDVDAPARSLRMAEQQLVEIAGAIGAEARILLMDEPTAALTDREADRLFALVRALRGRGVGIIYISHRLEEIDALADRVSVLRDGELVATRAMKECPRAELIRLMVGREIQSVYPTRTPALGDVVLDVARVSCRAAGVLDVTLHVRAGEILGLAGLVGAGRTELARVLFGLTPADQGKVSNNINRMAVEQRGTSNNSNRTAVDQRGTSSRSLSKVSGGSEATGGIIRLNGVPVRIDSPADAVRLGLAYVPEDRRRHGVVGEMSVAANVTLASLRALTTNAGMLDTARERDTAHRYAQRFAIKAASIDAPVETLSGGNQQKVALARWLATEPKVLLLDEPTQGVDVGAKAEIHGLIADLAARGLAIILISSELPEILGMCDRIAVMHAGTIVSTLDRAEATQERILTLALGHADDAKSRTQEVRH
jgi:rhamnose transport system ATP-binding protein